MKQKGEHLSQNKAFSLPKPIIYVHLHVEDILNESSKLQTQTQMIKKKPRHDNDVLKTQYMSSAYLYNCDRS